MHIENGLKVVSCTLAQLLDSANSENTDLPIHGQLRIPEYQRPYVWGEKQINKLLDDWIEYSKIDDKDKPLFYLGSIILHQDENNHLNIIDGQQRITTTLLFSKFRDIVYDGIEYDSSQSITKIIANLSYLKAIQDNEIFDFRNTKVLESIDLNEINVTLVVTKSEDLAYTFFETQNTGGVRLSGSDILKAHHLRAIPATKLVNYQARRWESSESEKLEYIIQQLTKIRFWDYCHW